MGDVTQHSLPTVSVNYAIDPRDSKSLPNHGQVQLRAHKRGAFCSQAIGSTASERSSLIASPSLARAARRPALGCLWQLTPKPTLQPPGESNTAMELPNRHATFCRQPARTTQAQSLPASRCQVTCE